MQQPQMVLRNEWVRSVPIRTADATEMSVGGGVHDELCTHAHFGEQAGSDGEDIKRTGNPRLEPWRGL
jgi:hypothetical protein